MKYVRLASVVALIRVAGADARAQDATDARAAIERRRAAATG